MLRPRCELWECGDDCFPYGFCRMGEGKRGKVIPCDGPNCGFWPDKEDDDDSPPDDEDMCTYPYCDGCPETACVDRMPPRTVKEEPPDE